MFSASMRDTSETEMCRPAGCLLPVLKRSLGKGLKRVQKKKKKSARKITWELEKVPCTEIFCNPICLVYQKKKMEGWLIWLRCVSTFIGRKSWLAKQSLILWRKVYLLLEVESWHIQIEIIFNSDGPFEQSAMESTACPCHWRLSNQDWISSSKVKVTFDLKLSICC